MIYSMQNLKSAEEKILNGEIVDVEVPTAYHAIMATQSLGGQWSAFLENAPAAILNSRFQPLVIDDVVEYFNHEQRVASSDLSMTNDHAKVDSYGFEGNQKKYLKNIENAKATKGDAFGKARKGNHPASERTHSVLKMFEECRIYGQRKTISVEGTNGEVFILRTPNAKDYDKVRSALVVVLELFRRYGENLDDSHKVPGISITIRGMRKFFDVEIAGVEDRVWCGFDFR